MGVTIRKSINGVGSKFIWSIQGILDNFSPVNGTNKIPIGSLADGAASANYSRVDLQEENPNGWRVGDKLIVPADAGGWYLLSFVCQHPVLPISTGYTQAYMGDFRIGIIINVDHNNQAMTGDAAGGRSDSGSFACPIKLQDGDEIEFYFDIETGQTNEDYIIRGSVIDLGGVSPAPPIPIPGALNSKIITQTLNSGDNTIIHNLGKTVINFIVQDGNDFVEVTGNIIDTNNFNLNLAAGSITNAKITFIFIV